MIARSSALLCALTLAACSAPAAQAPKRLDPAACRAPSARETQRLPAEWASFVRHVRVCEATGGGETAPLTITTVAAADYYKNAPSGATAVELPKPILFDAAGDSVGRLPFSFPDDPPFELEVTLAEWKAGRPERIELFLRDPTAGGDRHLDPLRWDGAARRYVTSPRK